jgi:hypothetical protein
MARPLGATSTRIARTLRPCVGFVIIVVLCIFASPAQADPFSAISPPDAVPYTVHGPMSLCQNGSCFVQPPIVNIGLCGGTDGFKVDAKVDSYGVRVWVPTGLDSSLWEGYCY